MCGQVCKRIARRWVGAAPMRIKGVTLGAIILVGGFLSRAQAIELRVCFVPDEDCTTLIVRTIDAAKSELLVQAYGFTSGPIIQALVNAKERGVDVKIILDKSNEQKQYTAATFLKNHGM